MWRKFVVIGGIAAAVGLGIGGIALAASPSSTTVADPPGSAAVAAPAALTTAPPPAATGKKAGQKGDRKRGGLAERLQKVAHGQWVTKDGKTGKFVTHDAIRGDVTAVSATSITVKAADGTPETFVVNAATKVHVRADAKGTKGSMGQVKVGDRAAVLGTGTAPMTATAVIDRGGAGSHPKVTSSAPATS